MFPALVKQASSRSARQCPAQAVFHSLTIPVSAAQGQGANGPSMSMECVLALLGVEQAPHNAHLLTSIWPALLVAPWPAPSRTTFNLLFISCSLFRETPRSKGFIGGGWLLLSFVGQGSVQQVSPT